MDALTKFMQDLVDSQFADMKGSWANLHLEFPEKLLNELIKSLLASKKEEPAKDDALAKWLTLVHSAHVKGTVSVDLKLNV